MARCLVEKGWVGVPKVNGGLHREQRLILTCASEASIVESDMISLYIEPYGVAYVDRKKEIKRYPLHPSTTVTHGEYESVDELLRTSLSPPFSALPTTNDHSSSDSFDFQ